MVSKLAGRAVLLLLCLVVGDAVRQTRLQKSDVVSAAQYEKQEHEQAGYEHVEEGHGEEAADSKLEWGTPGCGSTYQCASGCSCIGGTLRNHADTAVRCSEAAVLTIAALLQKRKEWHRFAGTSMFCLRVWLHVLLLQCAREPCLIAPALERKNAAVSCAVATAAPAPAHSVPDRLTPLLKMASSTP
ncbi:unnamed protein product [Symbiodinium sp. CCMP2592]|nr:unnamed protein product [Symbiodinium sp. CCMP2592]